MMNLLVFVSIDERGHATAPTLFLPELPNAVLPSHPRSLEWRYFATISERDELFQANIAGPEGLDYEGHYVMDRLVSAA